MNPRWTSRPRPRWYRLAAVAAAVAAAACLGPAAPAAAAPAPPAAAGPRFQATIVRTAHGIPHITAHDFGSLGYGYGFVFAKDNLCTMARGYLTVQAQRSRYFGPRGSYQSSVGGTINNLDSDFFWKSVIDRRVIPHLLAVRTGPAAITAAVRRLVAGYVAGYNRYLASVGGAKGVPDHTCRGKPWVKPITALDAYLRFYQVAELAGQASLIDAIATARPPATAAPTVGPAAPLAARQLRALGQRLAATGLGTSGRGASAPGSNAIAIGSAGTRDHRHGMLLGNPHFPWDGTERFYQVQLTIPGTVNAEGASLYGIPLVMIGFTPSMAWSHTVSTAFRFTPFQLTLVPGHPTEYTVDGTAVHMTGQRVTVQARTASGGLRPAHRTLWSTRYGPILGSLLGIPLKWTATTAFALADANADNLRFLNHYLATDEAQSAAAELRILKRYQGVPWTNTLVADSTGHALYADIGPVPNVTDAKAARCDTALGMVTFAKAGLPVLDGSRSSCALGTDNDAAAPRILGPEQQPSLTRRDFTENSNDSFWLSNPAQQLTGFPRIIGDTGSERSLRTRDALTMVQRRISGTDGIGAPGFTFADMKNLMFADVQFGASLTKPAVVSMCRSFPGGRAPTKGGGTIAVGNSCRVLAAWNGRENPGSRGAVLFRGFWERALAVAGGPWLHPFQVSDPVGTPNGLDTAAPAVQRAFGNALAALTAAHLPYNVALRTVQYVVRAGQRIPLPGGPGDPDGELNAISQDVIHHRGVDPTDASSYIQVVTWRDGSPCPQAATLLTYSESTNPASPYFADQTVLFSHRQWVAASFCARQAAAGALSTKVLRGG